ncbi:hypothetical protein [Cryptosporangium arvum]|uniref:Uncharacterized protein n=1 Tax=Cryptosporangium arvum DSM 44712 TaxID=927661 RepID=A0A010ZT28_9ACTN|nr:hypothetical protein [Cryptosporangium arvum]EXG81844.1 hypothetical protein CryarDRAFT_2965 [Cryptosporangium arvum DSM 44712]
MVDAQNQGWRLATTTGRYAADFGVPRGLRAAVSYSELAATRGPIRPVVPAPDADRDALLRAFRAAGPRAALSLLVALQQVFRAAADGGTEYDSARRTLIAGSEESWEAAHLTMLLGRTAPGGSIDSPTVGTIVGVLCPWVTRPDVYVEVAQTLSAVFASFLDEDVDGRPRGWSGAADASLQPGSAAFETNGGRLLYSWLAARSRRSRLAGG